MNEHALVPAVAESQNHFETAAECIELALSQESKVTKQINHLVDMAIEEKDQSTSSCSGL